MSQQLYNSFSFELDILTQLIIFRKKLVEKTLNPIQEDNIVRTCIVKCLAKNCK